MISANNQGCNYVANVTNLFNLKTMTYRKNTMQHRFSYIALAHIVSIICECFNLSHKSC